MAQILLNLEIGIRMIRRELDDSLSNLTKTLDEIEAPIHKICCKIRDEKDAFGNYKLVVPIAAYHYKQFENIYRMLLKIYEGFQKGLVCPAHIEKLGKMVHGKRIDIPTVLEKIIFDLSI